MLLRCSVIIISVIVKHDYHVGIVRAFSLPGGTDIYYIQDFPTGRDGEKVPSQQLKTCNH